MTLNTELALRKAAALSGTKPVEAASLLSSILAKFPNNPRARALLLDIDKRARSAVGSGTLLQLETMLASGRAAEVFALANALPSAATGSAHLQIILGQAASALDRNVEANYHFRAATQLQPQQLSAWMAAGNAAFLAKDWAAALQYFGMARKLAPTNPDVLNNLGMTLAALGEHGSAEVVFTTASKIEPQSAKIAYNRANAARDAGLIEKAICLYRDALRLDPDHAAALNNLGALLHQLGQNAEAEAAYLRAVMLRPDFAQAHYNLAAVHKYTADDSLLAMLDEKLAGPLPERDRASFLFARAKAHDDVGEHKHAFERLLEANAIRKRLLGYDVRVDELLFDTLHKLFDRPLPKVECSVALPRPVFIIGMMRSGTTLVEQILASHSAVHGAGEMDTLGKLCLPFMEHYLATGEPPAPQVLLEIRQAYLSKLAALDAGGAFVVTDKMPVNFRWVGFIMAAIPEARIIHMRRDPVATCWSIFKQNFSSSGNGYSYDLQDLATYWDLYTKLMTHWHGLFPGQILDVPYEALTEEPAAWSRRIVEFSGLPWEEACLDFHLSTRSVRTASALQVKRRIYRGSSDEWRKFEVELRPLRDRLGR